MMLPPDRSAVDGADGGDAMTTVQDLMKAKQYQARPAQVTFVPEPVPPPVWCPIISVDDHALEPLSLFDDFGPASLRDVLPRVEVDDDGYPH